MIWRILGFIGAGSFFVNGFSLLSDPSCISADFGGGRVIQVTCRSDSYGTFSGTEAGFVSLFIGLGLLTLIFFNQIKQFFNKPSLPPEWKNISISNPQGLKTMRICDSCEMSVPATSDKCPNCGRTYFNTKKVPVPIQTSHPELTSKLKICDNCKSEVHIFYPKCFKCNGTIFTNMKVREVPIVRTPENKTCPMCAEEIKYAAMKCRYCQHLMSE
jgi:hypothetical protein